MGKRFKIEVPAEPPVGTILENIVSGSTYKHVDGRDGLDTWVRIEAVGSVDVGGQCYYWEDLIRMGEYEDVTPAKSYALPEIPPVGSYVVAKSGPFGIRQVYQVRMGHFDTDLYLFNGTDKESWFAVLARHSDGGGLEDYRGPEPTGGNLETWEYHEGEN